VRPGEPKGLEPPLAHPTPKIACLGGTYVPARNRKTLKSFKNCAVRVRMSKAFFFAQALSLDRKYPGAMNGRGFGQDGVQVCLEVATQAVHECQVFLPNGGRYGAHRVGLGPRRESSSLFPGVRVVLPLSLLVLDVDCYQGSLPQCVGLGPHQSFACETDAWDGLSALPFILDLFFLFIVNHFPVLSITLAIYRLLFFPFSSHLFHSLQLSVGSPPALTLWGQPSRPIIGSRCTTTFSQTSRFGALVCGPHS
jgi:hypothetical protein